MKNKAIGIISVILIIGVLIGINIYLSKNEETQYIGEEVGEEGMDIKNLIDINTTDIYNQEYLGSKLEENELTLVNVWATWCPPCIAEMPHLEEVYQKMKEQNVGVVGIVTDVFENGSIDEAAFKMAEEIIEIYSLTFPIIYPDNKIEDVILKDLMVYPTTFFVDGNGNVVGDIYEGSRNEEEWLEIIELELEKLK